MSPTEIALIVFTCVFGGALLGMFLGGRIPEHHLSAETENVIKLGMGLIATIAALVLGLLIATAESSFLDIEYPRTGLIQVGAFD